MSKKILFIASALLGLSACQTSTSVDTPTIAIEGTWHIEAAQGQSVIDYSPAQLIFAADGTLSGNNSCNQFFGQYKLEGTQLTLSPAGSTMKACIEALMSQEQRVMQAMSKITTAESANGKLLLKDAEGEAQLVLSKQ
ncbi:META domain-containing protein [Shewanella algidipiscicola]|nr:META domain-containing protein [Shewanella algidipiscicola]